MRQTVSSLQKRCTWDASRSQGSQMPIPAMWNIEHSDHLGVKKEMQDGALLIP